jgi:hypothetical protein
MATARGGRRRTDARGAYPFLDDICSNPSGVPIFLSVSCKLGGGGGSGLTSEAVRGKRHVGS